MVILNQEIQLITYAFEYSVEGYQQLEYSRSLVGRGNVFAHLFHKTWTRTSQSWVDSGNRYHDLRSKLLHAYNQWNNTPYLISQCESLQFSRYAPGQFYRSHLDHDYRERRPRQATVMLYLNSDFTGGQTEFPNIGITVKPRAGQVLAWRYGSQLRSRASLHQALPVIDGTKYIVTLWIRT